MCFLTNELCYPAKNFHIPQHPDDVVQVQVLETIEERAILDRDDVVSDVLDDKDKVTRHIKYMIVRYFLCELFHFWLYCI